MSTLQGVDANYRDKQGLSLLHLVLFCVCVHVRTPAFCPICFCSCIFYQSQYSLQAALFNQTDIVFILMDSGASLDYKNAQGNYLSSKNLSIDKLVIDVVLIRQ